MATEQPSDKIGIRELTEIPRMVGETDIRLIRALASELSAEARIVEFGPWLGGVSIVLADYGELHVVDRFIWSDANAERYPGLAAPGENFRDLYETFLKDYGAEATISETAFGDFEWQGGAIDFCFIDGPRQPEGLLDCLNSIASSLAPGAKVLVKNGLNPSHTDMMALLHVLAALGIFRIVQTDQPKWCNIAVLEPGPELVSLSGIAVEDELFRRCPIAPEVKDSRGDSSLVLARLAQRLIRSDTPCAFDMLDKLPPSVSHNYAWDALESKLDLPPELLPEIAAFSEVFCWHNDAAGYWNEFVAPGKSVTWVLRAAWSNNADNPQRAALMKVGPLTDIVGESRTDIADRFGAQMRGRRVVQIGTGLGLSGTACIASGGVSYFGVESGELTTAMLRSEHAFEAVTYMPFATADPDAIGQADLILVDSANQSEPETKSLLEILKARSPQATVEILSNTTAA